MTSTERPEPRSIPRWVWVALIAFLLMPVTFRAIRLHFGWTWPPVQGPLELLREFLSSL